MCGCIEDMNIAVTRADCTEAVEVLPSSVSMAAGGLKADAVQEIEFKACQGINPEGGKKNNDLSAYVNRLVNEGKMSAETQSVIFETLVGYEKPNRAGNEQACQAALEGLGE
jgi:hypothetical protein